MALAVPPEGGPPPRPDPVARPAHPAARPTPAVGVVVVNFCQWRNTARLVRQLRRSIAARIGAIAVVIVDNDSPRHKLADRVARRRGVKLVRGRRNVGFARAVNRGAAAVASDWILLLNPDVTVPDGFLDDVLKVVDGADTRTGVIGFRLTDPDGRPQGSCGTFPTLASTLLGMARPRRRRKCRPQFHAGPVPWATGGCLLVRRECFEQLIGFDGSFFLYYEDVDFCRRAAAAGWTVRFDPTVTVAHHSPLHARTVPAPLRLITRHALLTYALRYWPAWQSNLLAKVVRWEAVARGLVAGLRGDLTARVCHQELAKLTSDVMAGRAIEADQRVRFASGFLRPIASAQDSCGRSAEDGSRKC